MGNGQYHRKPELKLKPCPKCKGAGLVPCDGKEAIRQASLDWANSYDLKLVKREGITGVAMAGIQPGGWGCLKIYYALEESRPPRLGTVSGSSSYRGDRINGKNILYRFLHWTDRGTKIKVIDIPELVLDRLAGDEVGEIFRILQEVKRGNG